MTKGAIASLVRGVAIDLAPRGITVNNVQPGPTATDMTASHVEMVKPLVPLGRMGEPDEVAGLVAYLASARAGFITGSSLTIDEASMSPVWHGKRRRRPTRGEQRSTDSQNDRLWNGGGRGALAREPRRANPLPMSALRSIATELVQRREMPLCAISRHMQCSESVAIRSPRRRPRAACPAR
jgi:Enoyl-(Acyl carrier protein) reductase